MTYPKQSKNNLRRFARTSRVGPLILDAITPICQQYGFIQARILLEWEYIVTPQFAQLCMPLKVTFPLKQRSNGRLFLRTTSSMAAEMAYLEPQILSRINQYFGYQAISKISVQQGSVARKAATKKSKPPLSSKDILSSLESQVKPIENDRLRAALLSFGVGIVNSKAKT